MRAPEMWRSPAVRPTTGRNHRPASSFCGSQLRKTDSLAGVECPAPAQAANGAGRRSISGWRLASTSCSIEVFSFRGSERMSFSTRFGTWFMPGMRATATAAASSVIAPSAWRRGCARFAVRGAEDGLCLVEADVQNVPPLSAALSAGISWACPAVKKRRQRLPRMAAH